ncbi:MAG: general secretion pathway protein GspK [Deltaproteobacteria bacterium]|nr:general secretion pathway protein GspK [Deltaproteobacteria bacterium]
MTRPRPQTILRPLVADQKGVVVLLVVAIIALAVPLVLEANRRVRSGVIQAAAEKTRLQQKWAAEAGVQAAMALLAQDMAQGEADTIQEDWAHKEKMEQLLAELGLSGVAVSVTDCLGRLQMNALVKPPNGKVFNESQKLLWDRFLRPVVTAHEDMPLNATTDIINCMKDWLDSEDDDATTGLNGAETYYYRSLNPPYSAKNGYFTDARELMLVKGVTEKLFKGTEEIPSIEPFLTVYGAQKNKNGKLEFPGKINLGTAPFPVIRALMPPGSEDLAEEIVAFREEKAGGEFVNDISYAGWYRNAPGCADLTIDDSLVTTKSDTFRIEAVAGGEDRQVAVTAWVKREKRGAKVFCRVLAWESS